MNFYRIVVGILISGTLSSILYADMIPTNRRPRNMSMGGAGLATEGDKDSAMINPASLADVEDVDWQIFPLTVEFPFNLDILTSLQDYNDVRTSDSSTSLEKREALESFLRDVGNESVRTRVNLYPSYTRNRMHFGLLVELDVNAKSRVGGLAGNQLGEAGGTAGTAGIVAGYGHGFFDESLQVGATLRPMYRVSPFKYREQRINQVLLGLNDGDDVKDRLLGDKPESRDAYGVGVDLGMKYWFQSDRFTGRLANFVYNWRPAVGLTYQDVGNTRFIGRGSGEKLPDSIQQSLSTGIAVHPKFAFTKNTFAVDFRNVIERQSFLNKVHFGAESVLWNFWLIRFGVSQGYLTGGMGVDLPFFEFDAFVSAEESGRKANIQEYRTFGFRISATL